MSDDSVSAETSQSFMDALARYFDLESDRVVPSARLVEDLAFDSLMIFELQVFLEELFPHEVTEDLLESIETVADLVWLWESNQPDGA